MRNLVVVLLTVYLVACEESRAPEDRGFHVTSDGDELTPGEIPMSVWWDAANLHYVADSVSWWNGEMSRDGMSRVVFFALDEDSVEISDVDVSFGDVVYHGEEDPENIVPLGMSRMYYDSSGAVYYCAITISSDISEDEERVMFVLRHELGHCLALADDPWDEYSVMGVPLVDDGTLTDDDWELLIETLFTAEVTY